MKVVSRIVAALLITTLLSCSVSMTALAKTANTGSTKKIVDGGVYTEKQLNDHNLSVGRIEWADSLLAGSLVVEPNKDYSKFTVHINEFWPSGLPSNPSNKMKVKWEAKSNFIPIRAYAQERGWWDCNWTITSNTSTKLVAKAKVEYRPSKLTRNPKNLTLSRLPL